MTTLQPGELHVKKDGEELFMAVSGSFLEVLDDRVVVLVDTAERDEDIDIARAEAAMLRAQERIKLGVPEMDMARVEAALRRSLLRLKVAERRRKRRSGGVNLT